MFIYFHPPGTNGLIWHLAGKNRWHWDSPALIQSAAFWGPSPNPKFWWLLGGSLGGTQHCLVGVPGRDAALDGQGHSRSQAQPISSPKERNKSLWGYRAQPVGTWDYKISWFWCIVFSLYKFPWIFEDLLYAWISHFLHQNKLIF